MEIGRINLILIGLILVILFGLISKDEVTPSFSSQTARIQTQILADAAPEAPPEQVLQAPQEAPKAEAEPVAPLKAEQKPASKKLKKLAAPEPVADHGPVVQVQTSQVQTAQALPVVEPAPPKEPSTKMLVFNIWSVSELRLRSAYTSLMNDSAIPPAQLEARKKDYLSFVTLRARKCGELDNKFAANINTVEKLSFSKGDVESLECHAAENNAELDKLSAHNF